MTTDAEIDALSAASYRDGVNSAARARLFDAMLETVARRERLARVFLPGVSNAYNFAVTKQRYWAEGGYTVKRHIRELSRLEGAMTYEDSPTLLHNVSALLFDCRVLQDEIDAVLRQAEGFPAHRRIPKPPVRRPIERIERALFNAWSVIDDPT